MIVLGFAGTAKNTGKTTTASRLLDFVRGSGQTVALTSIGYDGEDIDTVTGLPKPLYQLKPGDLIATASDCLRVAAKGSYKVLHETGINTILGRIMIAEVMAETKFVMAGPNRRTDLERLLSMLEGYAPGYVFIDGALNRIVPMIAARGLVLATGGSFDEDIASIVAHAQALAGLFAYPLAASGNDLKQVTLIKPDGESVSFSYTSVLSPEMADEIAGAARHPIEQLVIPGACYPSLLSTLVKRLAPSQITLGNPLFLAASGDPLIWQQVLNSEAFVQSEITYQETIPLLFITVNPFYPRFLQSTHQYYKAYLDENELLAAMRAAIPDVPVFNIETATEEEVKPLLM